MESSKPSTFRDAFSSASSIEQNKAMMEMLDNMKHDLMEQLYSPSKRVAVDEDILNTKLVWYDVLEDKKDAININKLKGNEEFRLKDIDSFESDDDDDTSSPDKTSNDSPLRSSMRSSKPSIEITKSAAKSKFAPKEEAKTPILPVPELGKKQTSVDKMFGVIRQRSMKKKKDQSNLTPPVVV